MTIHFTIKFKNSTTVNGNVKWCDQDKINNNQNSVVHKEHKYNHTINRYIWKIDERRRKLLILREKAIEDYKAFKKSYKNRNNDLTDIYISS